MSAFCPDGCPGPVDACVVGHPCALHPADAPTTVHVTEPDPPKPVGSCPVTKGPHRWAYLSRGGQACGYCGRAR